VKHEEVDPLADDIVGPGTNNFLKVSHFVRLKWRTSDNSAIPNGRNEAIDNDDFCTGFTPLALAMNMDRVVFVCVEHDDQSKIFIQLRHDNQSTWMIAGS